MKEGYTMRTIFFGLLLLASSLYSITLPEIIDTSLSKSPSLQAIQEGVAANKQAIAISAQFANPQLQLTKNSLDSSQAMSQTI